MPSKPKKRSQIAEALVSPTADPCFRAAIVDTYTTEYERLFGHDMTEFLSIVRAGEITTEAAGRLIEKNPRLYGKVVPQAIISQAETARRLRMSRSQFNKRLDSGTFTAREFDQLRTIMAQWLPWPPATERDAGAMMKAIEYARSSEWDDKPAMPLDRAVYEILVHTPKRSWNTALRKGDWETLNRLWREILNIAASFVEFPEYTYPSAEDIERMWLHWGPPYSWCVEVIKGFSERS